MPATKTEKMSSNLDKLDNQLLLKFFLNFQKNAQKILRQGPKPWGVAIKSLSAGLGIRNGKPRQFDDSTIGIAIKKLKKKTGAKKERAYIIKLIELACEAWRWKYTEEGDIEELPSHQMGTPAHYIAYYWLHHTDDSKGFTGVASSYLTLSRNHEHRVVFAEMELYSNTDSDAGTPKLTARMKLAPEGITHLEPVLVLRFNDEHVHHIKSQLSVYIGKPNNKAAEWPVLLGTYSSIGRKESVNRPIAGTILLQKVASREEALRRIFLKEEAVPESVYHYLLRSRLTVEDKVIKSPDELSYNRELADLQKYVGIYEGKLVSRLKNEDFIESVVLLVRPNSRATLYVRDATDPRGSNPREYMGRFRVIESFNNNIVGYFDYNINSRVNRFSIFVDKLWKSVGLNNPSIHLYGVYAGIEYQSDKVIAGRIRLSRLTSDYKADIRDYLSEVRSIPFDSSRAEEVEKDILDLLTGQNHTSDFVETLRLSPKNDEGLFKGEKNFRLKGNYYIYCLNTHENAIYRFPIEIGEKGDVKMKIHNGEVIELVSGQAFYTDQRLTILLLKNGVPGYAHYLFSVLERAPRGGFKHAFGISSRFNSELRPTGRLEVLVSSSMTFANEANAPATFFIESEEFKREDIKLKGLLTFLSGRYNRLVVAPMTPNRLIKKRLNEYVDIHFYAACYLSSVNKFEEAGANLYQAYLHGFSNLKLLEKEAGEGGVLRPLLDKFKSEVLPSIVENHHMPLKPEELIKKIRDRATYINRKFPKSAVLNNE